MDGLNNILALQHSQDEMIQIRLDIHQHPEIAFKKHRTAKLVAELLTRYGIEIEADIAGTGMVKSLSKGKTDPDVT